MRRLAIRKTYKDKILEYSQKQGLIYIKDDSGCNVDVQIIDLSKINFSNTVFEKYNYSGDDVLLVFDYAFGEQAYEVMDELLRPYYVEGEENKMKVKSISIMGKAGILKGTKRRYYDSYFAYF